MEGHDVKPSLRLRLPRLYVFILVMAIIFSALNILILFYGRNLFIYFQAIWSWSGVLLMSLIGAMLIGMFLSYRLLAYREFTPFERDMMEMRIEVAECKDMLAQIGVRLEAMEGRGKGAEAPTTAAEGEPGDEGG
jgi:hypothetical protein